MAGRVRAKEIALFLRAYIRLLLCIFTVYSCRESRVTLRRKYIHIYLLTYIIIAGTILPHVRRRQTSLTFNVRPSVVSRQKWRQTRPREVVACTRSKLGDSDGKRPKWRAQTLPRTDTVELLRVRKYMTGAGKILNVAHRSKRDRRTSTYIN